MKQSWRTIRVFISSTFRDMHAERDHLVKVVFPALRERCSQRHLHLVDVDLRWGVTQELAEMGKALEVCLREIEHCRPFFVGILSERYGYIPPKYEVPNEPEYNWAHQMELGHSITAMEIYHGVLNNPQMHRRVFFYFRDPSFIELLPPREQEDFRAEDAKSAEKLRRLKSHIRESGLPIRDFSRDDLEFFGNKVLEDLWSAIQAEYPEDTPVPDPLDLERAYHDFFIATRTELFIGQRHLLKRLHEYAAGNTIGPMIVTGTPGCGKSALLAKFIDQFRRLNPKTAIIYHFIGASPVSTDPRQMLLRLCRELAKQFKFNEEIEQDYEKLRVQFQRFVQRATKSQKIVLIVDALNQLDEVYHSHDLYWLPHPLPANLRLIISSLEGDTLESTRRGYLERQELVVTSLRLVDQGFIVARQLGLCRKRLTTVRQWRKACLAQGLSALPEQGRSQLRFILTGVWNRLQKPSDIESIQRETANPLYLKLVTEELRLFGKFEYLNKFIASIPSNVDGMFNSVLNRLEQEHGREFVTNALSLIAVGRHGLLENELLELLAPEGQQRLPVALWARLHRSLGFYIKPRTTLGGDEGLIDFLHRQCAKVVSSRYLLTEKSRILSHRQLAKYFRKKVHPKGDSTWSSNYPRGLSELPYHQTRGRMGVQLASTLCDLGFIEAKCAAGMTYDLVADYNRLGVGRAQPSPLIKTPWFHKDKYGVQCSFCLIWSEIDRGQIGQLIHCPFCNRKLKLNPFATKAEWYPELGRKAKAATEKKPEVQLPQDMSDFADFVRSQAHIISTHPLLTFQQAANEPDVTAPAQAARRRAKTGLETMPWLRCINKPQSGSPCLVTLVGHSNNVLSYALSPDGTKLVACDGPFYHQHIESPHGEIKLWDLTTGTELAILGKYKGSVKACAFSPNGKQIVSGSSNGALQVYDSFAMAQVATFTGHSLRRFERLLRWFVSTIYVIFCSVSFGAVIGAIGGAVVGVIEGFSKGDTGNIVSLIIRYSYYGAVNLSIILGLVSPLFSREKSRHDINACTFSPDGNSILTASSDKTLGLWNAADGTQLMAYRGHTDEVYACAFSPDGKQIISASADKTLKLWNVADSSELMVLGGHTGGVRACAFSPDGKHIISASTDRTLKLWDAATGSELTTLASHKRSVMACAFSPDGKEILSASEDQTLKLWDADTATELSTFAGHTGPVYACSFLPGGKQIISVSADKTIKLWDASVKTQADAPSTHMGMVSACAFSPDGSRVVSASRANVLMMWGRPYVRNHDGWLMEAEGGTAASTKDNLKLWDTATGVELASFRGHTADVYDCAFSPDGEKIASASEDTTLKIWDTATGRELTTLYGHTKGINFCIFSPDGAYILSASRDNTLKLWSSQDGRLLATFVRCPRGLSLNLRYLIRTFTGKHWLTAMASILPIFLIGTGILGAILLLVDNALGFPSSLKVSKLVSYMVIMVIMMIPAFAFFEVVAWLKNLPDEALEACVFSPDGARIVSGGGVNNCFGEVILWDTATGAKLAILGAHSDIVKVCVFSPDGLRIVSGSRDGTLKLWDTETGAELATLKGHNAEVEACAFSPDGKQIVSASVDKTLMLWDVETGTLMLTLSGHTAPVNGCVFSSAGERMVSVSEDKTLRLWEGRTIKGEYITSRPLKTIAWSPDGHMLAAGDESGRIHLLRIENIIPSHPVEIVWHSRVDGTYAFGCLLCRKWSIIPESALGTDIPCPNCSKVSKLNPFAISADWRPIAKAWKGG